MTPKSPAAQLAALVAVQQTVNTAIEQAESRWRQLGETPGDFVERGHVADEITRLRAQLNAVGRDITACRQREMAFCALEQTAKALSATANAELERLLADFPSRERIGEVFTLIARANNVAAVVAEHGGSAFPIPHVRYRYRKTLMERLGVTASRPDLSDVADCIGVLSRKDLP